jgi:hypothetical protein
MGNSKFQKIKWYRSIGFLILIGFAFIPAWDLGGVFIVMNTKGKELVLEESSRLIEQIGNNVISSINIRASQIEALCRTMATTGENLPKQANVFKQFVPHILNFNGDLDVAGGGIWPEPYRFNSKKHKRSFFYGRNKEGKLIYYDDYNHGRGYIQDEWYPVVRYSQKGRCFWSKSYMDPHSFQPMVTCTVAMWDKEKFWGVTTIDLKLEGLYDYIEKQREKTGGYIFLLDRNNKFLTFPDRLCSEEYMEKRKCPAKIYKKAKDGKISEDFITIGEYAKKESRIQTISNAVENMNKEILSISKKMKNYKADYIKKIDKDSDQISKTEAEFITSVIADPLVKDSNKTNLYKKFNIDNDFIINDESIVYLFHIPFSYWKLVVVKPMSEAQAVASTINAVLLIMIAFTILTGITLAAYPIHRFYVIPLKNISTAIQKIGPLLFDKKFTELKKHRIKKYSENELGHIAMVLNKLSDELVKSYGALVIENLNKDLKSTKKEILMLKKLETMKQIIADFSSGIGNIRNRGYYKNNGKKQTRT